MTETIPSIAFFLSDKLSSRLERELSGVAALPDLRSLAVMPDVHSGSIFPNGLAAATRHLIYPELVGGDIGCGVSAIKFDADEDVLRKDGAELLRLLRAEIPTIKHRRPFVTLPPELPRAEELSAAVLVRTMKREGLLELGTLGRGNHFIEFDRDESGGIWLVVHSGSRAMGQHILRHHGAALEGKPGPRALDRRSAEGQAYLRDADWALRYARFNRLLIINRIADIMEGRFRASPLASTYVDSPHNFVRAEVTEEGELIVHRKSANSAARDELGLIPGSMATGCRLVRGLGNAASLSSSSHGAGRRFGRKEAFGRIRTRDFLRSMEGIRFDRENAALLRDESPQAYRDIDEVMGAQRDLVRTVSVLRPLLNDKRI